MIQKSLESLETRLKLKNKARKTLVDEMVHQTRTPLTILKIHLEGMEDGIIQMEPEEIKICEDQIDHLSMIITNMSELIDAGTNERKIVLEEFDLVLFMKQILNGMKSQFQNKNINLELLSIEKMVVQTDKYRLGQTVYNVLTNAYKFTQSGGKVSLQYYREGDNLHIEIADTGVGISEEKQLKIFDAYYKGDAESGGMGDGLGLFIAKENIESMGGRIKVISREGKGSRFILIIPI